MPRLTDTWCPTEWRFQDEGYSGAPCCGPGWKLCATLAAAGHLEAVLIHSPDRLSRKYAYQVLLAEELSRCGVELVFLKAPSGSTPEDQLLVQFQGMIAEYERAQIAERSRRGKRHRRPTGIDQRALGRSLRLPLCAEERYGGGLLRGHRSRRLS